MRDRGAFRKANVDDCFYNDMQHIFVSLIQNLLSLQGYQLCVMDYDFLILNNAFLIHRPGIKTAKSSSSHIDKAKVGAQNDFIKKIIMPELKQLYGTRKGCEK